MKTLSGAVIFTCLFLVFPVHAESIESDALIYQDSTNCLQLGYLAELNTNLIEKRGCCSHHGGVCGCSGSRQKCCDGTLSPSCTCYKPDSIDDLIMKRDSL